ncbi:MAG: cysteine--tRNA ligase [Candidatus Aenigmatarchaeota archaeon]|nr:MAG: cysteine--tRNA ligase [Candidatus Aenigmarchaeota archaeon]
MRFYNTMTKKKEVFKPLEKGVVRMYNCGPTVYDYAHIGNFRAYIFADVLRRYLEYKGYKVMQVMNITDVGHMTIDDVAEGQGEDKIEKKAREEKKDPWEIAEFYIKAFLEDSEKLNLLEPMKRPRATEHIEDMIKLIEKLIEKGYAYVVNGSVYYDVTKFKDYGKLSGNTIDKLEAGKRVEVNPEKRHWFDFALWIRNPKHIMQWDSPWGKGYPGWHIECSAMSMKYLGETLDIHTGGEDNIFPHHECEIAQSEGATGKTFVRYWMHTRHLMVNGRKMSKSLGNYYTLRDIIKLGYSPRAFRYLIFSANYRTKLNFTLDALKSAEETLKKIDDFVGKVKALSDRGNARKDVINLVEKTRNKFESAMDDDLNTSEAMAAVFDFMAEINKMINQNQLTGADARVVYEFMLSLDKVFGLSLDDVPAWYMLSKDSEPVENLEEAFKNLEEALKQKDMKKANILIGNIIKTREEYRKKKEWNKADSIRSSLKKLNVVVEDTPEGPRWKVGI